MIELTEAEIDYGRTLMIRAMTRAEKALNKFPQPNYVLTKLGEEAGEAIKAGVHLAEERGDFTAQDLEYECIDTIAMCFRLLIEGDQVHGVPAVHKMEASGE